MSAHSRCFIVAAALGLAACHAPTSLRDLDAPVFGRSGATSFIIDTDRPLDVRELARFARVIRLYKELTPIELTAIQRRLQREVEDLIAVELQALRPGFEKNKVQIELQHRAQLDAARGDAGKSAALLVAHKVELQQLETKLHEEARDRVLARLGNELALPLRTSDNRSVVAFGRMDGEQLQVTSKAYELDVAAQNLKSEAKITASDGSKATLVGKAVVKVDPPAQ